MGVLDDIKDRLDCIAVIGRDIKLNFRNVGICPFHAERTESFHAYTDHYHCFGCGAHGDVIEYVQKTKNLSFQEALRACAREAGVTLHEDAETQKKRQEHLSRVQVLRKVAEYYHGLLKDHPDVVEYLHGRGYTDDFLASYLIGYTPGNCVGKSGVSDADLRRFGLLREDQNGEWRDYFYKRIMFPVWGRYDDEIVDLDGRVTGDAKPKYLHLPGPNTLLNARGLRGAKTIYLAEGDTDTATLVQAGLPVVGVRGVQGLSEDMAAAFKACDTIYVCADNDAPKVREDGTTQQPAGLALIERCGALFGNRARILTVPKVLKADGQPVKDVSDYIASGRDFTALAADAPTYIDWLLARLPERVPVDSIDGVVSTFVPVLRTLGKGAREGYVKRIAKRIGITIGVLNEELRGADTNGNGNGNGKNHGADPVNIIWQDKPSINPAQALVDGKVLTTIFLDTLVYKEDSDIPDIVRAPHIISSSREVFPLNKAELFARGLRVADTKIPAHGIIGQRWRTGADHAFGVKNFIDSGVTVQPWDVYCEVLGYFKTFLWYPNPLYFDFLALWTIGTYFFDLFPAYPYCHLLGTKRCGKTLTLDIVEALAFNAVKSESMTSASLFRTVEGNSATLLMDEAENMTKRKDKKDDNGDDDKLEILKGGYKKGGKVIRCVGDNHEPTGFDVYSPKMFGGTLAIDRVLGDRVVALTLARKDKDLKLPEEFSPLVHLPRLHETRDKLHILMLEQGKEIYERFIDGIQWDGVTDRAKELWAPILVLAMFFDDCYLDAMGEDFQPNVDDLLTAKMRRMATENVAEREAGDRLDQTEVTIIEAVLEYLDGDVRPVSGDWYASAPILRYLQERDELTWLKTMRQVYNELEKTTAISKANDVDLRRPAGTLRTATKVRCVRLDKVKLQAIAKRLGGIDHGQEGDAAVSGKQD